MKIIQNIQRAEFIQPALMVMAAVVFLGIASSLFNDVFRPTGISAHALVGLYAACCIWVVYKFDKQLCKLKRVSEQMSEQMPE